MNQDNQVVLKLENVSKLFVTDEFETHALREIFLEVLKGEFLSIEGPSGSGKTTLLSVLGLLDPASSGRYELLGTDVMKFTLNERASLRNREIGFVFQNFNLIGDLSVEENVELPLSYRGVAKNERKKRAQEALERVGMGHRKGHLPSQLSGGQQQRVAVARAIAGRPTLILADEPTGNLDSTNGQVVMELLRDLNREGTTICMVTHNPEYGRYASRIIELADGQIIAERRAAA